MSEAIKPDLVLPLTRAWFSKIWNGEKRTEYRAVKPYWTKRIGAWIDDNTPRFILFQIGYAKDGPRLLVQTTGVDIGPCPYPGWRGDFYRIRFGIVQPYMKVDGVFHPMTEMPKMKGGDYCNGGDCERHRLGAEPCAGCEFCDEEGNI
jgi:hypothetical protein